MKVSKSNNTKASNVAHVGAQQRLANSNEQVCDICTQLVPGPERVKILAFGKCDHHICYVCSARLRALCDQQDCPICREKLDIVIFSRNRDKPFSKCDLKSFIYNEKYKIYFEDDIIKAEFNKLLRYECLECIKNKNWLTRKPQRKSNDNEKISPNLDDKSPESNKDLSPNKSASRNNKDNNKTKQNIKRHASKSPTSPKPISGDEANNVQSQQNAVNSLPSSSTSLRPSNLNNTEFNDKDDLDNAKNNDTNDSKKYTFSDVNSLKGHLFRVHKLKLCDLCLDHNKLFPFEFSYYDQTALRKHVKEGEPKTSHRGHPTCELCQHIYFNLDELLFHMNRDHFHCHLCERTNSSALLYFLDYAGLRDHFKKRHILCERDNCRHEQFTSAFENQIDYQLHVVQVHENQSGAHLTRGESRQQRTITLDPISHRARESSPGVLPRNATVVTTGITARSNRDQNRERNPDVVRFAQQQLQMRQPQRLPSRNEFPALGQSHTRQHSNPETSRPIPESLTPTNNTSGQQPRPQQPSTSAMSSGRPLTTLSQRLVAGPSEANSFVRTLGGGRRAPGQLDESNFPPLPEQPKPKNANKKSAKQQSKTPTGEMSLDQQIRLMWVSNSRSEANGKKHKANPNKKVKQKPLKIQLS